MTKSQNQTAIKQYLLSAICGYDDSLVGSTDEEKIKGFFDGFYSAYGQQVDRKGLQRALQDWLQGSPSLTNIEFTNSGCISLLVEWKLLDWDSTENKVDRVLDNYWVMLAKGLIVLGNKYKAIR